MVDLRHGHARALEKIKAEVVEDQRLHHHGRAANDKDIEAGEMACQPFERFRHAAVAPVRFLNAQENHQDRQHKGDGRAQKRDAHRRPDTGQEHVLALDGHVDHRIHKALGVPLHRGAAAHGLRKAHAEPHEQRDPDDPRRDFHRFCLAYLLIHGFRSFHKGEAQKQRFPQSVQFYPSPLYSFKAQALKLRGKRKERIGSFPGDSQPGKRTGASFV